MRHYAISGASAKYRSLSRVRPLFLYRHHGSHARSRVSSGFVDKNVFFMLSDKLLLIFKLYYAIMKFIKGV